MQLVSLNGQILDKLHHQPFTYENVVELESMMAEDSASIGRPGPTQWPRPEKPGSLYETLVKIHMLWWVNLKSGCMPILIYRSRLTLRAPLLRSGTHWISSLAICHGAAQMLLSIYFEICEPAIRTITTSAINTYDDSLKRQIQESVKLPPTWRQVRRITTSTMVILYAFWKGETSHNEACRFCATALLLLEFQRTRYGPSIEEATSCIRELAETSGLSLQPFMKQLVPEASDEYLKAVFDSTFTRGKAQQMELSPTAPDGLSLPGPSYASPWGGGAFDDFSDTFPAYDFWSFPP